MKIPNKIAAALAAAALSGCALMAPAEELISPPKLTGEQAEIYRALTNGKGGGLTLKYPKSGEYRSAFVYWEDFPVSENRPLHDEEITPPRVIVFYKAAGAGAEPTLWLTFLVKREGRWECTNDIPVAATDIERVEFSALGDSGSANLIISYSFLNRPDKSVSVISVDESGIPKEVYTRSYCVYYETNRFLSGAETNLFIVSQDRAAGESRAELAGWKNGEFLGLSSIELNPDSAEFIKITEGFIGDFDYDMTSALFLEYSRSDNTCNTGIVYKRGERLNSVVYVPDERQREANLALLEKSPNAYTGFAFSRDIDGDGFTETAGNADFPGYGHMNPQNRVRAAIWYGVGNLKNLERQHYTYLSANNDYVFFFPNRWEGKVTVTVSPDLREVTFWAYHLPEYETVFDAEYRLLSVTAVPKEESAAFLEGEPGNGVLFDGESSKTHDYYAELFYQTALALTLTQDELEESLVIFGG
ncbi:MAG: hypothetical protein LBI38_03120 [Oscillospiraceae bacterium]|jgi:hypothetical protein|nr:hypothetical protein [Oscillospiraceae bacterium]